MPDGSWLELRRHDTEYVFAMDGFTLMTSRIHDSEDQLAKLAFERSTPGARVLVGGLGMGFTLRAVLDRLPLDGLVAVAELVPEVVAWNRAELGEVTGRPLEDSRVSVEQR